MQTKRALFAILFALAMALGSLHNAPAGGTTDSNSSWGKIAGSPIQQGAPGGTTDGSNMWG